MSDISRKPAIDEGTQDGIEWRTVRAPLYGAVNGYARLPEGHTWIDGTIDVDVHGGVTYGPDEARWIGFDTLHAGDNWPGVPEYWNSDFGRNWTEADVAAEARRLASQIAAAVQ